ncbi:hypothetical protein T636_A1504 [Enterobacter hormaechei subsp. xiangfangensis]|nr:hypothetical protein T636_A1504 [Enterobacter hormaechei subsp. xiangfangensis]
MRWAHMPAEPAPAKPGKLMGGMLAHQLIYPATCKPRDIFCAQQYDEFLTTRQGYSPAEWRGGAGRLR